MSKNRVTQKITLHMTVAIILATMMVLASMLWMSRQQDKQAVASSARMVAGGLDTIEEQIRTVTESYSRWPEAMDNLAAGNREWVNSNLVSGVTGTGKPDVLAIIAPDRDVLYEWDTKTSILSDQQYFTAPEVDDILTLLAEIPPDHIEARHIYIVHKGQLALIAAARISPEPEKPRIDGRYSTLVMGYYLSPERLSQLGATFLIDDLGITRESVTDKSQLPLIGTDGQPIGYLFWTPLRPGISILAGVMIPVSLALGLFALITWRAMSTTRQSARDLAASEAEANKAARTDSLSRLPNRLALTEQIALPETSQAATDGQLAVIYIDINGFKAVNDTAGHSGGDELIRQIAERLRSIVPPEAFLARVGGDEFNVLLNDASKQSNVYDLASLIIKTIDQPYSIHDMQFRVTASVGYSVSTRGRWSPLEVFRHADIAMYNAKAAGTQVPVVYDQSFESGAFKKKQIEEALRRGIEDEEISVVYQPILRSCDRETDSIEALVRWKSDKLGQIPPDTFIPISEETGLINDIGTLVMRKACRDLKQFQGVKLNLNISPVQLHDPLFAQKMAQIADEFDIPPMQIEFELTEGIMVSHPELAGRTLNLLKDAGFGLALDDFGTGFSSIGYLRRFPFDRMKIDRSFVADIGTSSKANSLMQSLITLGDALDLQVVAEGIETAEQGDLLTMLGCEFLQGYFFSRPIPIDEFPKMRQQLERKIVAGQKW